MGVVEHGVGPPPDLEAVGGDGRPLAAELGGGGWGWMDGGVDGQVSEVTINTSDAHTRHARTRILSSPPPPPPLYPPTYLQERLVDLRHDVRGVLLRLDPQVPSPLLGRRRLRRRRRRLLRRRPPARCARAAEPLRLRRHAAAAAARGAGHAWEYVCIYVWEGLGQSVNHIRRGLRFVPP